MPTRLMPARLRIISNAWAELRAAANRRTGAGRKAGIQAIDIKGQVDLVIPQQPLGFLGRRLGAVLMDPGRIQNVEAHGVIVGGAQADLHRARRVDDAFPGGMKEHGAMVDPAVIVRPGVGMGVEVQQGKGPVFSSHGPSAADRQ